MNVDFWLDPICPWCWLTSRWIDDVAPHRDLTINWRSISLMQKNELQPDSPFYEKANHTLGLLRVFETVKTAHGNEAAGRFYTALGTHIHIKQDPLVAPAVALADAGLDAVHADAYANVELDALIRSEMEAGLALVGNDVGTPIIGFDNQDGNRVGFFGPVISRRLNQQDALDMWDGMMLMGRVDSFWELKRTRTQNPSFGPAR